MRRFQVLDWSERSLQYLHGDGAGDAMPGRASKKCVLAENLFTDGSRVLVLKESYYLGLSSPYSR